MRVVAARLIAQHDAGVACVLAELEDAERWGPDALNRLVSEHGAALRILRRELEAEEENTAAAARDALATHAATSAAAAARAECERRMLSNALGAAEEAWTAAVALTREQAAAIDARDGAIDALRGRLADGSEAIEAYDELTRRAHDGEAEVERLKGETATQAALLGAAAEREAQLEAEMKRLLASQAATGERLRRVQRRAATEQAALKVSLAQATQQNAVLRSRLVMLHATIHGMHDGASPVGERLRKGREAAGADVGLLAGGAEGGAAAPAPGP